MKRTLASLLALLVLLTVVPAVPVAAEDPFVFSGKGFGHGIGMSQYGAKAYANQGWGYQAILKHYYTGIETGGKATGGQTIKVLLSESSSMTVSSGTNAFKVINEANGGVIADAVAGSAYTVTKTGAGTYNVNGAGGYAGPIRFDPPGADQTAYLLTVGGKRYRGSIRAKIFGSNVRAVNLVDFELYLRGIAEMPSSWPMEALKAQAVAARTYAYPKLDNPGDFDLYADTRSQVYNGYEKEGEATYGVRWVQAVTGTWINGSGGVVATYGGTPISALYSSSSGGKTEHSENVWGTYYAYLRGVNDAATDSPYDNPGWSYSIARAPLESALGVSGIREIQIGDQSGFSPRAKTVRIVKDDGTIVTMPGTDLRSRLGSTNIKSTWFTSISSPGIALNLPPVSGDAKRGDVDGDGKADLTAFYNYGGGTSSGWAFLSNGSGFAPWRMWLSAPGGFDAGRTKFLFGDYDGDGKEDTMGFFDYGGGTAGAWMFKSTGRSFAPSLWWRSGTGNFDLSKTILLSGDFNKDGRDDVLAFYNYGGTVTGAFLFAYNGNAFEPVKIWHSAYWDSSRMTPIVADTDGSGEDRVVAFYDYGNQSAAVWVFDVSPAFSAYAAWSSPSWDQKYAKPVATDLTGDGKDEILAYYDYGRTSVNVWNFPWNGGSLQHPSVIFSTPYWNLSKTRLAGGDYDGDGKGDVAAFYDYGAGTSGLYMFKMGATGLLAYPWWNSGNGNWSAANTMVVKDAPEPKFTPSPGSGFGRVYKLIALDAGHGGTDPGAVGNGLIEKTVNLDVMLKVRDLLVSQGYQVVTTRTTDTDVNAAFSDVNGDGVYNDFDELAARVNVANNARADIYLSIHHNASEYAGSSGVMVLYGPQSGEGKVLASKIAAGMSAKTGMTNLGEIARGDLYQTTKPNMPGVISEGGYLTNSANALFLMGDSGRLLEAQGIVDGINAFYASR
ncbi:MAG: SpoIID/LytB domain-containing protein [Candidatus Aquicultorales bacterium]